MTRTWSIQEVVRSTGLTSRALRHYDTIGLLPAGRGGGGERRTYDEAALRRLQRILLLRELGMGLSRIRDVLDREGDEVAALAAHVQRLREERDRLDRRIAAVERTLAARERGEQMDIKEMFDGFDHAEHREEVVARWGEAAYSAGDRWWRGMDADTKRRWQEDAARLGQDWLDAAARRIDPGGEEAQALADRHIAWLKSVPGTPAAEGGDLRAYVLGLADMYVADERFAANYGGPEGAAFVRSVLRQRFA